MSALRDLVLVGAGGFGREILAWARHSRGCGTEWRIKGFIDDAPDPLKNRPAPAPLLGTIKDWAPKSDQVFVCAVGVPELREKLTTLLSERGAQFIQLIHSTVVFGNETELGDGVVLCPYSLISSNARVARGAAVNCYSSIDHDAEVGEWSQISCHCDLTAAVRLGKKVFLGSNVAIIPNIRIEDSAYVGAGSVVTRDVPAGAKVVGNPARRI
jgi:sugar O-acyltransferase (sialic acid O-acetyltransferase NeuD family)